MFCLMIHMLSYFTHFVLLSHSTLFLALLVIDCICMTVYISSSFCIYYFCTISQVYSLSTTFLSSLFLVQHHVHIRKLQSRALCNVIITCTADRYNDEPYTVLYVSTCPVFCQGKCDKTGGFYHLSR